MAEEQEVLSQEDPGTADQTDEEIWDDTAEETDETEEAAPQETETEEPVEEEEVEEVQEEVEEDDEEPQHDFEKRYKDLEREFHKRNEDTARLKDEYNDMRLRFVEQQQAIDRISGKEPEKKVAPDPSSEDYFTEEDKDTMNEFGELTKTFQKLIQHELAKGKVQQPTDNSDARIAELEKAYQNAAYGQFLKEHDSAMRDDVGDFYRDLDKDADFQSYVLASPALTKMMTESTDYNDHASVMNLFLDSSGRGDQWRGTKTATTSQKKQARRAAASGLSKSSAPRMEKPLDSMSDEELWEAVPEPKEEE